MNLIEQTTTKWCGSISIKSQFKSLTVTVTSSKDSCAEAIRDIMNEYKYRQIEGITIQRMGKDNEFA